MRAILVGLALTALLIAAGCSHQPRTRATYGIANPPEAATRNAAAQKVINDWWNGGINHRHSCGAVRAAITHLPEEDCVTRPGCTIRADLRAYERTVC